MFGRKSSMDRKLRVGEHDLEVVRQLGEGGMAFIFIVRPTGVAAGLKSEDMVLKKATPSTQEAMDIAQKEAALSRQLRHPNIVEYYGDTIVERRKNGRKVYDVYMLMELCPGGHLLDLTNNRANGGRPLSEQEILGFFLQICRAVDYLHRHTPPIAHRDLKLENVLLGKHNTVKLCDFGSCVTHTTRCEDKVDRVAEEERIDKYTTPNYRAPEMCDLFSGKLISEKVDIWALGCMLFAMCFQRHAFEDGGKLGILSGRFNVPSSPGYSKELTCMFPWLFNLDPEERPPIGDVLDYVEEITGNKTPQHGRRSSCSGKRPTGLGLLGENSAEPGDAEAELSEQWESLAVSEDKKRNSGKRIGTYRSRNKSITTKESPSRSPKMASDGKPRRKSAALQARLSKRGMAPVNPPAAPPPAAPAAASSSSGFDDFFSGGTSAQPAAASTDNSDWDAFAGSSGGGGADGGWDAFAPSSGANSSAPPAASAAPFAAGQTSGGRPTSVPAALDPTMLYHQAPQMHPMQHGMQQQPIGMLQPQQQQQQQQQQPMGMLQPHQQPMMQQPMMSAPQQQQQQSSHPQFWSNPGMNSNSIAGFPMAGNASQPSSMPPSGASQQV